MNTKLKNVSLEVSLKPFKTNDSDNLRKVVHEIFYQWQALNRYADTVSVLLWIAEGSEILEYRGSLDDEFEWARYFGLPNKIHKGHDPNDPDEIGLDRNSPLYIDNPPVWTYGRLKDLNTIIKEVGAEITGKPIRVGATFDPGPEFAVSEFKYKRHPEILDSMIERLKGRFIHCNTSLKGDDISYAGFPDGIPEGTHIGTFLGAQSQHFMADLGFDYIWFSNALGFGLETWGGSGVFCVGSVFNGSEFNPDMCQSAKNEILAFWKNFRKECPEFRIETRGSNLPTSMMLGVDAVPVRDIYNGGFNMYTPVNSPWAALDGDFGIELIGWMSRIAELPEGEGYPFRFYTHDPWWLHSPWQHQYMREAHDIYLPLSVARLNEQGKAETPEAIDFLSIDDSHGDMPVLVPNEVIPPILDSFDNKPDRSGPICWIYPFDEYHDITFGESDRVSEILLGDLFLRGAMNEGLPVNTVISSENYISVSASQPDLFKDVLLLAPTCLQEKGVTALSAHLEKGGSALLYGPIINASEAVKKMLNLKTAEPLEGDFSLQLNCTGDLIENGSYPEIIRHDGGISGGGIETVLAEETSDTEIFASVTQGDEKRVIGLIRTLENDGRLGWLRATNSFKLTSTGQLDPFDAGEIFRVEFLARFILNSFGFEFLNEKRRPSTRSSITTVSRSRNGFYFHGYKPDTRVKTHYKCPQGAPVFTNTDLDIKESRSVYAFGRAFQRECRAFVLQNEDSEVQCKRKSSRFKGIDNRISISGLKNAVVRFFPETGTKDNLVILKNPNRGYIVGEKVEFSSHDDRMGQYIEIKDVTGEILISW